MSWLGITPENYEAALWTMAVGVAANVSCAILGCYLVLRRLSLLGDAISHAVLPGIAIAFLFSGSVAAVPMFLGALVFGLLTALLTQTLHAFGKVPEDASMGVVFTSLFALGVLLITHVAPRVDLDPGCVLYGLIEFVPLNTVEMWGIEVPRALRTLVVTLAVVLVLVTLFWKEFKIVSFDPLLATSMGISALFFHYLMMALVAGVTVASFEAVGSILVVAMLIVPGATAHLMTDRLNWMMLWSSVVAVVSAVLGYAAARHLNTSVAGMMAVVAGCQFALAVLLAPRHGLVSKALNNLALATRIAREDLLALLYRQEEAARLAETGNAAPPAGLRFSEALRASRAGWIAWLAIPQLRWRGEAASQGGELRLTPRGRETAVSLVRSHRLWEAYLDEHFQLPRDHLHEPAERLEHFIGAGLQEELADVLRSPQRDPHGKEIPAQTRPAEPRDEGSADAGQQPVRGRQRRR